ncbi:MAG: hypothetical protein LBU73_08300 [Helicobacteraceae bacterium]|jgi:UDPglucose--hexose-1-phosphate uridylyltransferase|nr:hypothetical protein [Helicobacteraceae bacterium]
MNEFRYQPLYDEWVIIAPNRVRRPERQSGEESPRATEMTDPFVTGSESKTTGEIYAIREKPSIAASWNTRVFANKFPLLNLETSLVRSSFGAYASIGAFGAHEMVIDHQKPNRHLCSFTTQEFKNLMMTFRDRISALSQDQRIASIMAFKNQGAKSGNTIPHSHSQIVALPFIAPRLAKLIDSSRDHYEKSERCLTCDIIRAEENEKTRVLMRNRSFIAFAPYAPRYEFEVWIAPIIHSSNFAQLTRDALGDLGEALEWCAKRLGIALEMPDINLLVFAEPPKRSHVRSDYFHHFDRFFHWHIELLPRIKSLGGFEAESGVYVNPIAPEEYALYLKEIRMVERNKKERK